MTDALPADPSSAVPIDPVDVHVGSKIRERRQFMGLSQTTLSKGVGLTFQQVQKYENGTNRVSSSKLYALARMLRVPVDYFFHGLPATSEEIDGAFDQFRHLEESEALVAAFTSLPAITRRSIVDIAQRSAEIEARAAA